MLRNTLINFTLKFGLAISLVYTGLEALVVPDNILKYWPEFLSSNIHDSVLVLITTLACLALVVWLFSNKGQFASVLTFSSLVAIIGIANITDVPFLIDIAPLFFISVALSLRYYPRIRVVAQTKVTPLANITIPEQQTYKEESIDINNTGIKEKGGEKNKEEMQTHTETVIESDIHTEHDQHIFVPKQ